MVGVYHWVVDGTAPFEALSAILDYLWEEELNRYEASPTPGHVFEHLAKVANWMNSGCDWTAEEYVGACRALYEPSWRVAGMFDRPGDGEDPGF